MEAAGGSIWRRKPLVLTAANARGNKQKVTDEV